MLEQLAFSASITGPICLMLVLGVFLKRANLINEEFIETASKLVFKVTLPALLFLSIVQSDYDVGKSLPFTLYGLAANLVFFLFMFASTKMFFKDSNDIGVIVQGGFRSNLAIIGLAYMANMYGEQGVANAALYVGAVTVLYNILAVIALSPKQQDSKLKAFSMFGKSITKNPLIIAILLGFVCYALSVPIPEIVSHAGGYFADMTLPLALLCTGGSLNLRSLKKEINSTWFSAVQKLFLCPLIIVGGGLLLGYRGMELGLLFFMTASPTAAASYVMARAMGGNPTLAANIIALTTVGSLLTCSVGIAMLTHFGLM
ncbi:putative auxin efflux carrier [Vibrio nigripulchritudo MADA3029]|uniref:AEC family transporter n=1 Tax=Vibrio nigripulchritudo TaxID=28173 RepID=UPI0003B200F0|nr:AEC family transporter [Vibrio nigripulchritudo]CCN49476.1 putative auxin efflux carrier [Vibrio nigripulchritudo MADA3020]CCN51312.1 putative auxin efflux carrier [Vibrio nigripulchritudo MADA3021]CCN59948.1 putative auxin efflux carrier [Vibrio nigripulchritudo MADA3029]